MVFFASEILSAYRQFVLGRWINNSCIFQLAVLVYKFYFNGWKKIKVPLIKQLVSEMKNDKLRKIALFMNIK